MKITPVDEKLEIQGSPLKYGRATLFVARANNVKYKKYFRELLKPYKNQIEKNSMDESVAEDLMIASAAKCILVGWENLTDVDGKEWEYSVENAESLLKDDKDVYEAITEHSESIDNYINEAKEETKGK